MKGSGNRHIPGAAKSIPVAPCLKPGLLPQSKQAHRQPRNKTSVLILVLGCVRVGTLWGLARLGSRGR